jgi:putative ABC transport system ATP-binding protein
MTVELIGIGKSYAAPDGSPIPVLESVTFRVGSGEMLCVAGRSGSGKTTLLTICGLLLAPDAGRRLLDGEDLTETSADGSAAFRREHIGFCFQDFLLVPTLTAIENVLVPLVPDGVGEDDVDRAGRRLAEVGLADRTDHLPSRLSGGEQQRVAFARALVRDPRLLLIDEPTANLDRRAAGELGELLRQARDSRERTIVVASHDPLLVEMADRVLELDDESGRRP